MTLRSKTLIIIGTTLIGFLMTQGQCPARGSVIRPLTWC